MPVGKRLVPARSDMAAYKDYDLNLKYLQQHKLQWLGERGPAAPGYAGTLYTRAGFTLLADSADPSSRREYKVGSCISIAESSQGKDDHPELDESELKGDIFANNIGSIQEILEDEQGHCWIGVHYFWRWGQIHAGADTAGSKQGCPNVTGLRWSAELIRQAQHLLEPYYPDGSPEERRDAVIGPGGVFREVISAAQLEQPVTVLGVSEVQAALPALSLEDALDAYENLHKDQVEVDSGSRKDFFFWRYTYDHTCYTFVSDPKAYGGSTPLQHLAKEPQDGGPQSVCTDDNKPILTMADFFCGAGHMAVAARMAGWTVRYGVDAASAAVSSFNANTADYPGAPFNLPQGGSARGLHCTVDGLLADVMAGKASGLAVDYMHFSPPCQDLSQQKKLVQRKLDGKNLMVTAQLIGALQPPFVTLEEVPGLIAQGFAPGNILVYETAKKLRAAQQRAQQQRQRRQQRQSQSQAQTALSQSFGVPDLPCDFDDAGSSAGEDEGDDGSEGQEEQEWDDAEADELAAVQAAAASGDPDRTFRPFLLLVPQLLSSGYQVRMCMLNSAHYGVPQSRWRLFLFAAKHGYELPDPPTPRYTLPEGRVARRPGFTNEFKVQDPTFMTKSGGEATAWWGVLTAATDALINQEQGLLPHVTVAEAVGDLPPIMTNSSSSSARNSYGSSSSWHLAGQLQDGGSNWQQLHQAGGTNSNGSTGSALQPGSAAAAAAAAGGVEQQGSALPPAGTLFDLLAQLRAESVVAADEAEERKRRKHSREPVVYGLTCRSYQPQQGVLLYQLPPPVADLRPVSQYAQYCRRPHWAEQGMRDFNPGLLRDHVYMGPTRSLTKGHEMSPLGVVGTVVGNARNGSNTTHMAEQRRSTLRERARFQGVPDWMNYCGRDDRAKQLQIGNAVPYLLAVEVTASVFKAATGQDGQRPPALVGPSLDGVGVPVADLPCYMKWVQPAHLLEAERDAHWHNIVVDSRAAWAQQLVVEEAQQPPPSRSRTRRSHTAGGASGGAAGSEVRSDGDAAQQEQGSRKRGHEQQQQQQQADEEQQQPAPQLSQQQGQQHDASAGVSGQQRQQQQECPPASANKRSRSTHSVQ